MGPAPGTVLPKDAHFACSAFEGGIAVLELSLVFSSTIRAEGGAELTSDNSAFRAEASPEIVHIDAEVALAAGRLRARREKKGRPVAQADMLIAASALVRGITLVTRNVSDFEGCGIALLDPFD